MKANYPSLVKILILFLILSMFVTGLAVPSRGASATAQTTPDPGLDQYGGWKGIQGHNTTGHWTVELIGDRYWFITPDNNVLWDLTCLHMYPGKEWQYSPVLQYSPTYLSNLAKYGGDLDKWGRSAGDDMASLGFNTRDAERGISLPIIPGMNFMAHLDNGYYEAWNADEMNVPLLKGAFVRKFPDVFDVRFQLLWEKDCKTLLTALKDNPRLIAVNLGGEQEWHGGRNCENKAPDMFIAAPRTYACKQWWVNTFLKGRYDSVQALNVAYGTTFTSWDDLLDCTSIPDNAKFPAIVADKLDYTEAIADQYYSVMTTEVKKIVPNALIFSERWAPWLNTPATMPYNERIWKAAGKYCDVMSIQGYENVALEEKNHQLITRCAVASGKPFMITESSSYANDTSVKDDPGSGSYSDWTQMDRAKRYVWYMKWIYDCTVTGMNGNPNPVHVLMGRHWYMWYNNPELGAVNYDGKVGEYFNWGIHDNQDERYIPFADVMATVNKQSYAVTTGQHPLIVPDPPTPVTPATGTTVSDHTTFTWKAIPNARSYTLLLSPERAFPDAQTIRVDRITGTSYTLSSPLAQGNWWWTVCAVEDTYGYSGLYPDATNFRVKNDPGTAAATLDLEQLNRVTFEDIWDSGGAASSYAFLDTTEKSEGASSARCVFTEWAWNKTGVIGRNDASVFIDCTGAIEPWTGVNLAVRPTTFCDTTEKLVPSSKYLRVRAWNGNGKLFLDWPLDPEGKLPIGQWSTVTVPFGTYGPQVLSKIALTLVTDQDKLATDQRLTINIDDIIPMTKADDDTAPPAPLITNMTLSSTTIAVSLDVMDPESGIKDAQICIGKAPGVSDLLPWTTVGNDLSLSVPFTAAGTSSWYMSAKAQNGAGIWSAVTTIDGSQWTASTKVTSLAEEHGSLTPTGTVLIPAGGTQKFSPVPDFGYVVRDILVDGVSAGAQPTVTVQGDGKSHSIVARFVFNADAWRLDSLPTEAKTIIFMPVGSTTYQKNGAAMALDAPPYIDSGRTLVPVRAISEGLGADVQWNAATRVVTLSFQGLDGLHVVNMTIGEMAYRIDGKSAWMDVAPVIVGGRTFVPLRTVSESLGAQVDWNAGTRTVLIQGVNANSTPLDNSKTLKELYEAARTWDTNGNGISDFLEPFFLQSRVSSQPVCERTLVSTEVLARTDDTTPAVVLPALSTVVPIGVHGVFTKVRYNGQLTGYIPTDVLERRTRNLPSVSDTEKWVLASGPSLQSFLDDAVKTQWLGYLTSGQTITSSGNAFSMTDTGSQPFGFETEAMINVPTGAPNGAFGIQFRMTSTVTLAPDHLEKTFAGSTDYASFVAADPSLYFVGHRGTLNTTTWLWSDFRTIETTMHNRLAREGPGYDDQIVSDGPVLRSGQMYDIRFPDGTGRIAVITLPDGTVVDTIDMTNLAWNDRGGCFPDHKLAIGIWDQCRSSITISDLAFVVPPTTP